MMIRVKRIIQEKLEKQLLNQEDDIHHDNQKDVKIEIISPSNLKDYETSVKCAEATNCTLAFDLLFILQDIQNRILPRDSETDF